jgi:hypothetical protein
MRNIPSGQTIRFHKTGMDAKTTHHKFDVFIFSRDAILGT